MSEHDAWARPTDSWWSAPIPSAPGDPGPTHATGSTPPVRRRGSRRAGAAVAAGIVVAAAAGAGIGHLVWSGRPGTSTTAISPAPKGSLIGGGLGSSGTGPSFQLPGFGGTGGSFGTSPVFGNSGAAGAEPSGTGPSDASAVAKEVAPGLVDISTELGYEDGSAAGTGMVLTSNGEVLTNNHVIEGATSFSVTDLGNGRTYRATVVGYDRTKDVAVLKLVGASGLTTVRTDTAPITVGTGVVGIGNALGAGGQPSSAAGTVTALDQSITASDASAGDSENLTGLIESNAAIEPGDSGGPLADANGEVVGMDTAASTSVGFGSFSTGATQSYAIPISTALEVARAIESGHRSETIHLGQTPFLGVQVESAASSGVIFNGQSPTQPGASTSGAVIEDVVPGGPAAEAGLTSGDTITALGDAAVTSPSSLSTLILQDRPGQSVTVTYLNASGSSQTATVHLASGPPQ